MTNSKSETVVILGAGGYLGGVLCQFFHGLGSHRVVAIFRRQPNHRHFSDYLITDVFDDDWSEAITRDESRLTLINCAFDFKATGEVACEPKYRRFDHNITRVLQRSALTRLINISSLSACSQSRSHYGREKLFVEWMFSKHGGINVRLGLVVSPHRPGSAFLSLMNIVRSKAFVPILAARNSGFPICDLELAIVGVYLLAIMHLNKSHTLSFCYRSRLPLGKLVESLEQMLSVRRLKIPVPWRAVYFLLALKEAVIGKSKVRADSVLDFASPPPVIWKREFFQLLVQAFGKSTVWPYKNSGFYFLEDASKTSAPALAIRLRRLVGAHVLKCISDLSDPHRVGD